MKALQKILEEAVDFDAESVTLEYASEGLEIYFMRGHMGAGHVISDKKRVREIIRDVVDEANLERKAGGTIHLKISNKPYTVRVEEYDNFGDSAFRLSLKA
ncbi:MAG: hypothetical protein AAF702_51475 [Chloroflexota bacterium]